MGSEAWSTDSEVVDDVLESDDIVILEFALVLDDREGCRTNSAAEDVLELVDVDGVEGKGVRDVTLVVAEGGVASSDSGITGKTTDDTVLENSDDVVGSLRENLAQCATKAASIEFVELATPEG